jgi:bifunctional non-homologous end joining protein LigD
MAFQRRKPAAIGVKARFPGFVEPALATSIERVPQGERWIHEIKFDGYRIQLHIANEDVKVFTRRGNDWTRRFRKIAHDAFLISASSAIIDGEVVVPAADGTTDFSVLQNELKVQSDMMAMVAFDLLRLRPPQTAVGRAQNPSEEADRQEAVQFSESFEVDGPEMFKHACGVGLEGIVSKVRDSRYSSGRGNDWVKKTCAQRETLTIAGFSLKENKFDGFTWAASRARILSTQARSTTASTGISAKDLEARLKPLVRKTQPYAKRIAHRESGSSRPCSRKSNIGQSPPR